MTDSGVTGVPPVNDAGGDYRTGYTMETRLERVLLAQTQMLEEQTRLLNRLMERLDRLDALAVGAQKGAIGAVDEAKRARTMAENAEAQARKIADLLTRTEPFKPDKETPDAR